MSDYMIEYDQDECERLRIQSISYESATRKLLTLCRLSEGMAVLDVGTGTGEVAILAADIVGSSGFAVGIDRDCRALDDAQTRISQMGLSQVSFEQADLADYDIGPKFDLVIGRLVVWCQAERVSFVRRCASLVKAGGCLALLEEAIGLSNMPSDPPVKLYDESYRLVGMIAEACGFPLKVGSSFVALFEAAGLSEPTLFCEVSLGGAKSLAIDLLLHNLRAFDPWRRRVGLSFPGHLPPMLLRQRLLEACDASSSQLAGIPVVGALVRVGGAAGSAHQ